MKTLILTLALLGSVNLLAQEVEPSPTPEATPSPTPFFVTHVYVKWWPKGEGQIPSAECTQEQPGVTQPPGTARLSIADYEAQNAAQKAAHPFPTPAPHVETAQEKSERIIKAAQEIYSAQPAEARAGFLTMYAAAKVAVREGDFEAAQILISQAPGVPSELEPVRQQLLSLFNP